MDAVSVLLCMLWAGLANGAPVNIWVVDFSQLKPLVGHKITILETGDNYTVDTDGYARLDLPVGTNITVLAHSYPWYQSTQSATVSVPPGGLATKMTEIVLQVPSSITYDLFQWVSPGKKDPTACQVVVTVCNVNKTIYDFPQGLPGAVASLRPAALTRTFYFGTWGRVSNDTNPFPNNLTSCSWDGGVLFENVKVNPRVEYVVTAQRRGFRFSKTRIRCLRPGQFINAAPNQGPRAVLLPDAKPVHLGSRSPID